MTKARDLANASTALSAVSATELAFVDGVTSAIQTQMDAKAPSSTAVTLTDTQTLTNKTIDTASNTITGAVTLTGTQTLTNKTLTNPVISSVINNTLTSTTGDIIYASAANTPARLGIGSSAQVLTVSGGIPAWATTTATADNFTLLNSGGTSLTGTSTTISGISGKGTIWIAVTNAGFNSSSEMLLVGLNGDTGANYSWTGSLAQYATTYTKTQFYGTNSFSDTAFRLGQMGSNTAAVVNGGLMLYGCNSSGKKAMNALGSGSDGGGQNQIAYQTMGVYNSSSTISSVTIKGYGSTFTSGTVYVYASA